MKVHPINIPHDDFLSIPEDERILFVQTGRLLNEIMIIQNTIKNNHEKPFETEYETKASSGRSLYYYRQFAGILWEGWQMLQKSFFGTKLSKIYEPKIDGQAKKALDLLKSFFNAKGLYFKEIRDSLTYHYDHNEIKKQVSSIKENMELTLYLTENSSDTLHWYSDEFLGYATLEAVDQQTYQKSLVKLRKDTEGAALAFISLASELCLLILAQYSDVDWKAAISAFKDEQKE